MNYDIIVVGGGPAGLSFAQSLTDTNLKVLVIEKAKLIQLQKPQPDGREIALTHKSVRILKKLKVWDKFNKNDISPIKKAEVLSGEEPALLEFDSKAAGVDALGYLIPNYIIRKTIFNVVKTKKNITINPNFRVEHVFADNNEAYVILDDGNKISASLIVAADSRFSTLRKKMGIAATVREFSKTMIVCRVEHEKPHNSIAKECFFYGRTMAILPLNGNISSILITVETNKADELLSLNDKELNSEIQKYFNEFLGNTKIVSNRYSYPLSGVHADKFIKPKFALIGDASVGMHPVTAHGFNLGLSGQNILAKNIKKALANNEDIGSLTVLKDYERRHMLETKIMYLGTNSVVSLFTNDAPILKQLRKLTLKFANNFPPLKYVITEQLTESKKISKFLPWM